MYFLAVASLRSAKVRLQKEAHQLSLETDEEFGERMEYLRNTMERSKKHEELSQVLHVQFSLARFECTIFSLVLSGCRLKVPHLGSL